MASQAAKAVLKQNKTVLFISDMQEKFVNNIYGFDKIVGNISKLLKSCKVLNIPVVVTEQNPEAMGKTIPEIDLSGVRGPFAKTQWSMCTPEVMSLLNKLCDNGPPESIILAGIASHVCIENTAIDLKVGGFEVHTAADCCSSSTKMERDLAFERMKQIGCFIGTTESIVFKLVQDSRHKDIQKILEIVWPKN